VAPIGGPSASTRGYLPSWLAAPTPRTVPASRHRVGPPRRRPAHPPAPGSPPVAAERFLTLDTYRVKREWKRYEGTPQRDLFRELRLRFLARHAPADGWAIDVGCGPGRFLPRLGGRGVRRAGFDLSSEMLRSARTRLRGIDPTPSLFRADARRPPVRPGAAQLVAVLGNTVGFAGADSMRVVEECAAMVAPGGRLLLETAPGNGERSRYLARLPPGAVRRLLSAPLNLVRGRIEREGFVAEGRAKASAGFRRVSATELTRTLTRAGFTIREIVAVAPSLGPDAVRIQAVRPEPAAWNRLLEVEEVVGRSPARCATAAALLVAADRTPGATGRTVEAMS
jgi:SAM-dependent methyltransferase